MTQLNTPYPATAFLTGHFRSLGHAVTQSDLGLLLALRLFSRDGLAAIHEEIRLNGAGPKSRSVAFFQENFAAYLEVVDAVVAFLQGKDPTLAYRLAGGGLLPTGPRFQVIDAFRGEVGLGTTDDPLGWAFGAMGLQDRAKYLASLFIDDLGDVVRDGIDHRFGLARYGEKLAASAPSFAPLEKALQAPASLIDRFLADLTHSAVLSHDPQVVGLSVPFPGNVYGAFRMAQVIKRERPDVKVVLGGGWVNTELRSLSEPKVFDYVDYITLDDGERPLQLILEHLALAHRQAFDQVRGEPLAPAPKFLRTYIRRQRRVELVSDPGERDVKTEIAGTPTYDGLPLSGYLSVCEMLNPMHRLWSDGRWNKLMLAHGCYWRQCSFCDVNLDYIGRYEEQSAERIVARIEQLIDETGQTGFHFVDEAAPPKLMLAMAQRLITRGTKISWWGNVRFEKTFTPEVAAKLARSGCIAISGGLEVASDRLLKLMNKGVTVEQVARVTHAFADAGVLVHAYLMYGFPTQTALETVEALERVRQLFVAGCIHSAYWHRFSVTAHSPIGKDPGRFGIRLQPMPPVTFAQNDLAFEDLTGVDHDRLGLALRKATYNFMHGVGLDADVRSWFENANVDQLPRLRVPKRLVAQALSPRRTTG